MAESRSDTDRHTGRWLGWVILLLAVGGAASFVAARNRWWLLPVASVHGVEVDRLIYTTLIVTGLAFVLVHVILAAFVWRYAERGRRAAYWPDNRTLELTYTLVPAAVLTTLILMGSAVWARLHSPAPADALTVDVRGEQFGWLFRYPGPDGAFGRVDPAEIRTRDNPMGLDPADPAGADDIVVRELHLPAGRPVRVRLRSKDVLHSFFVPALRVKQDAVPGMTVELWFTPTRPGAYEIACAELCGVGHYIMRGRIVVDTPEAFQAWLAQQGR
ncbi:MAG: cytochrome c oxidase subunit II [Armatimonadota bacterium]|nr:cytochrome c oxidase subunit II [Armatimonadota bacterium]MDR7402151.1 cytochrome c oxidase subunit II [Armatimonadota bacterium]MDR7404909.1 cytochrome c oxidase subunit II [Armatimonadota bacterium]MDR7436908.1 cytochrome c oxidase subunit II [Armatimonadota bacterium]MDR7472318.1 cytochrome c oxidase subunit II [Armatimonadota bacterium]